MEQKGEIPQKSAYICIMRTTKLFFLLILLASCAPEREIRLGLFSSPAPVSVYIRQPDGTMTESRVNYEAVRRRGDQVEARADLAAGDAVFHFEDSWTRSADELTLQRTVRVEGSVPGAGFSPNLPFRAEGRPAGRSWTS